MELENRALVLDLLAWVGDEARPYDVVMDAWRTSCPRLPIWEDALESGLVACEGRMVRVTARGRAFLADGRNGAAAPARG